MSGRDSITSPPSSPDERVGAINEYLQLFSSHFRDAVNGEVDMLMESIANFLPRIVNLNEVHVTSQTVTSVGNDARDEEKENLRSQLERSQALVGTYKSALKVCLTIIEKSRTRDSGH